MRKLLVCVAVMISLTGFSQPSDFLILKKKGKTAQNIYAGNNLEFTTKTGAYRNGLVKRIHNDTLFIQEFQVRHIPTTVGGVIYDTVGSFSYNYSYHDILSLGKTRKGFNVSGSGYTLMGGAALLVVGSGVSYLIDKDKFSPELLLAAVGLGGVGYLMSRAGSKGIVIGKKGYSLQYMDVTP
ncbi:MAG: hypothetical protein EOO01_03060 [Chitinophagaceae bacterium]|nr:MAG: hypothetical protein EOO01_03060 [Chitinophagaceae bacterium]